jgi:hypothetical protein
MELTIEEKKFLLEVLNKTSITGIKTAEILLTIANKLGA